jgi:hypothetical protein
MATQDPDWQQATGSPVDLGRQRTRDEHRRKRTIGNFFLMTGAAFCVLGCAFTALTTLYGLGAMTQVSPLIPVSTENSILLLGMVFVDGVVKFCFLLPCLWFLCAWLGSSDPGAPNLPLKSNEERNGTSRCT